MTKSEIDAFRRRLERLILDGTYTPSCQPSAWWSLWARIEDDVLSSTEQK